MRARDSIGFGGLRQLLLDAIVEQPRYRCELIQVIAEQAGSKYRPRSGFVYLRPTKLEDDGLITGTRVVRRVVHTITDRGREDITVPAATSRRVSAEPRRAEPEGKGAQLSTAQRVMTEFVRDVNDEMAVCAKRGDLSLEPVRRLETELNPAHEAIARRLGRP